MFSLIREVLLKGEVEISLWMTPFKPMSTSSLRLWQLKGVFFFSYLVFPDLSMPRQRVQRAESSEHSQLANISQSVTFQHKLRHPLLFYNQF